MTDSTFHKQIAELRQSIYLGNVSEGVVKLVEILQSSPQPEERVEILLELILLSFICNDHEEARDRWSEVNDYIGKDLSARLKGYQAVFDVFDGKRKRGLTALGKVIEEEPNSFELHLLRAIAYIQCNQFEHAQADLVRASTLSPNNILVLSTLADVCVEVSDIGQAMALHEAVLAASPDFRRSLMSLGVIYFEQERFEEAFRLFQCLVAYDPMNWFAWNCLADIRVSNPGRTFQALPYYAAAIVTNTEISLAYLNLAKGLMMLGKYEQAVRVLDLYPKMTEHEWHGEELTCVRYIKLLVDVIRTPEFIKAPEFMQRFKLLKPCADNASLQLFTVLSIVSGISYRADINQIFTAHVACFVQLAQYLAICNSRVIYPEETMMLGTLIRMFIWHGMRFEARTLLSMLESADDPRIQDMCAELWNEMYRQAEAEGLAGMDLGTFHHKIVHASGVEQLIEDVIHGEHVQMPNKEIWLEALETALGDAQNSELRRIFLNPPVLRAIQTMTNAIQFYTTEEEREDTIIDFWHDYGLWETWHEMSKSRLSFEKIWAEVTEQFSLEPVYWPYLRQIVELHLTQNSSLDAPKTPEEREDKFEQILQILATAKPKETDIEITAANSNAVQYCSASPEEALSGFAPLPFALDGTAFKRILKDTKTSVARLNHTNCSYQFKAWLKQYYKAYMLSRQTDKTMFEIDEAQEEKVLKQAEMVWRRLHGEKPIQEKVLRNLQTTTKDLLTYAMQGNPILQQLETVRQISVFEPGGYILPKSPLYTNSVLLGHQQVPDYPKAAQEYACLVSLNLFTMKDLEEAFFNYAVTLIDKWLETKDDNHLEFIINNTKRDFTKFKRPLINVRQEMINALKDPNLDESVFTSIMNKAKALEANSDVESEEMNKAIVSTEELAASLESYLDWSRENPQPHLDTAFDRGFRDHAFMQQFKYWAHQQAEILYPEIIRAEAEVHSITPATSYVVTWHLKDMINRYPWLSRLYLLQASAYARVERYDQALETLESGLKAEHELYANAGWFPIMSKDAPYEQKLDAIEACNELEESQQLLWSERYVFQPRDEAMYHYASYQAGYAMRQRRPIEALSGIHHVSRFDKGGAFEFYQLFKRFIPRSANLRDAFCSALATDGVVSLRDILVHVITQMVAPETFPLRRQIAELLFALYPCENSGALGRFYCDNMQPANGLPMAAYAYFAENSNDEYDDASQASVTLGCLLYDLGFMDNAMEYLQRAVKVKNPSPMAFLTLGCALIEIKQIPEAIECLQKGLKLDPTSDRFHYNLALSYIELNQLDEAEQHVKTGIQLSKYPIDLNLQLMRIYVKKEKFVEALALARYVASEDPDMFLSALKYNDFEEFIKLKPVEDLLKECGYRP